MPRLKGSILTFGLCALVLAVSAAPSPGERERTAAAELAMDMLDAARSALVLGWTDEAASYADGAIGAQPLFSDALYLRAVLAMQRGEAAYLVQEWLERSLAADSFSRYSREGAELLLARVFVRVKRPAEALALLKGKHRDAELLYTEFLARRALGEHGAARASVEESLARYPHDPRPLLGWLLLSSPDAADAGDARLAARAFASLELLKETEPLLLPALAPYASNDDEARLLVREYRAYGRTHPLASILAYELGISDSARAIPELLAQGGNADARLVSRLYLALPDDTARAAMERALAGYSGTVSLDEDGDGIAEALTSYGGGLIRSWRYDRDQDGRPELLVSFANGEPKSAVLRTGAALVELRFERWPYVSSARVAELSRSRTYHFGPASFAYPALSIAAVGEGSKLPFLVRPLAADLPRERAMASMAYRLDENEGSLDRTVLLLDGIPSRSWWLDVYGASGDISYDRGQPRRELLDLDGDGRYEARKLWYASADGSVSQAYVETDLDGDGLYEYRESLGSPRMRSWDMDGDGAADMVVHEDPDGSILYSFRPSWISREPLLVRVREGRPVEFMRSGRSLALSRDSAPSLWWIGKKPFDLGVRPASEGVYAKGSQRYALIRIGGEYYAELLD